MSSAATCPATELDRDGYVMLRGVFTPEQVGVMQDALAHALDQDEPAIKGSDGAVYAARNILALWPAVTAIWKTAPLEAVLRAVLGGALGLVRVLYFDKPPGQSWALPWHKDLTIAVQDNTLPSEKFRKPTR